MTAMKFASMNTPSSSPSRRLREAPMRPKAPAFFDDPSLSRQWSEIESTLASAHTDADNDTEISWIEGCIHETRATQKEVEIFLVHPPPRPRNVSDAGRKPPEALRIFITCPELSRFVFAINQFIKVSLKGARVIHELVPRSSGTLPFSLLFSNTLAIQSVHGGVCMPDGIVIDAQQDRGRCTCLEFAASNLSLEDRSPSKNSSESMRIVERTLDEPNASTSTLVPLDNGSAEFDEYSFTPALSTLVEGMMTPLLGIIEIIKPLSSTATGELCVGLTIADASSYSLGRGFRVTLFSPKSRLARELPEPSEGNAILLKAVKINKWPSGIIGTVYANNLDWIVYDPKTDNLTVPRHSKNEPLSPFYNDLETRKELFRSFIRATEVSSDSSNGRGE